MEREIRSVVRSISAGINDRLGLRMTGHSSAAINAAIATGKVVSNETGLLRARMPQEQKAGEDGQPGATDGQGGQPVQKSPNFCDCPYPASVCCWLHGDIWGTDDGKPAIELTEHFKLRSDKGGKKVFSGTESDCKSAGRVLAVDPTISVRIRKNGNKGNWLLLIGPAEISQEVAA